MGAVGRVCAVLCGGGGSGGVETIVGRVLVGGYAAGS